MEIINVIKEPYSVRKNIGSLPKNKFVLTFLVDRRANKIMIKKAFKAVFGVKVKDVNTIMKNPKPTKMTVHSRKNYTKQRKLAYISLTKEDFLNLKKIIEGEAALQEAELQMQLSKSTEEAQSSSEKKVSGGTEPGDNEIRKIEHEKIAPTDNEDSSKPAEEPDPKHPGTEKEKEPKK